MTLPKIYPESDKSKAPAPLNVKRNVLDQKRYVICYNCKQAPKDKVDREAILASVRFKLKNGTKALIGNKGYRKYLKVDKGTV